MNKEIFKEFAAPVDGVILEISQVPDQVFSQKMMGDGFAVIPATGEVTAPLSGKIVSVFPTKHAIGMQTAEGAEVLIHMGLDTVQMSQPAFEILVSEGQEVVAGTTIAQMNLDAIKNEGKETTIIVVFTDDKVNGLTINKLGDTERGTVIGKINL